MVPVLVLVLMHRRRERERLTGSTDRGKDGLKDWGAVELEVFDLVLEEGGRRGGRRRTWVVSGE